MSFEKLINLYKYDEKVSPWEELSKDKLVIVVTHNFDQVQDYATRKIRLFDGEIAEVLLKDGEMVEYGKPLFKIK